MRELIINPDCYKITYCGFRPSFYNLYSTPLQDYQHSLLDTDNLDRVSTKILLYFTDLSDQTLFSQNITNFEFNNLNRNVNKNIEYSEFHQEFDCPEFNIVEIIIPKHFDTDSRLINFTLKNKQLIYFYIRERLRLNMSDCN